RPHPSRTTLFPYTTLFRSREFTPDGVRISYNLQGKIRGQYDADHMETVEAIFKQDGTYEFESLGMDQTVDGDMLLIKSKGTGRQDRKSTCLNSSHLVISYA